MRLCLFTPVFLPDVGGAEVALDALARQFQAKGHDVTVLAKGRPRALDVPYTLRWAPQPVMPHWFPERIGRTLRQLHAEKPFDLFFSNYTHPTGYAAIRVAKQVGRRVPVVIGSQGGDLYHSAKHRRQPHIWKRTVAALREADALVAISPHMEALMREIHPGARWIERIPNGVDPAEFAAPSTRPSDFVDPRPFMLCLGNLGPMKGFDNAIRAYARVREQLGDMILVIVGSGPLDNQLRGLVKELGLGGQVLFMGHRGGNDKRWFLQNCRFGLMPSIEEGLALVSLEFMASGKPLIVTTNPSFDGVCEDGENALRLPPRDDEALSRAMVRMQEMDLQAMGAASLRRVDAFAWPRVAERYLDLFERVLRKN
mgnify:CR=1 FL=1